MNVFERHFMNETEKTESLLRKAPRLRVPPGLREKLQGQIVLRDTEIGETPRHDWPPFLRRWLPVLAFSAFFLACVVAIAVQSNLLSELRRENEGLRASGQNLEQLRQDNSEYQRMTAENQQLERLRNDNLEVQQLRIEAAQLRSQLQELSSLQTENQRLLSGRKAAESRTPLNSEPEDDPFEAARKEAQRAACVNNLKQIGLAARMWSNDHGDFLPSDFLTMSNELNSPRVLTCRGDTNRAAAVNWSAFGPGNVSYELLSPGISETKVSAVYVRCPIHNNVLLADGSVHMIDPPGAELIQKDGEWVIRRGK